MSDAAASAGRNAAPAAPPASGGAAESDGGGADSDGGDELTHPCPICLIHEDDDPCGGKPGYCSACGQLFCGSCNTPQGMGQLNHCATCRAPIDVSPEESFARSWRLLHNGRTPGRHTPIAQFNLGAMYDQGRGVEKNLYEAERFYKLSADQGIGRAQCNLAVMYYRGRGVQQDYAAAEKYFKLGADQGFADAQYNLGAMYYNGEKDYAAALKYLTLAAKQGWPEAQCTLGTMYASGKGVPQDCAEGCKWYQVATSHGSSTAAKMLDAMQEENQIPAPPPCTAITATFPISSPAAAKYNNRPGVVLAPTPDIKRGRVGVLLNGETKPISLKLKNVRVVQTDSVAFAHPCPICADNEEDATVGFTGPGNCWRCGQKYCGACKSANLVFRGSPICPTCAPLPFKFSDEEEFQQWLECAHCDALGDEKKLAQCKVGNMYFGGRGVAQNDAEAFKYFVMSAEQGVDVAQVCLGIMYNEGRIAPKDPAAGCRWFQLAAAQGNSNGIANLESMQESNLIPTPPPGTAITTTLLTSAASSKYSNRSGVVVTIAAIKPGRVGVLLDGEPNPISLKLKNVQTAV